MIGDVYTVRVNRDHINNGTPDEPDCCALALAVREMFDGIDEIEVEDSGVRLDFTDMTCRKFKWVSSRASDFITAFDNKQPVEPDAFDMLEENAYDYGDFDED